MDTRVKLHHKLIALILSAAILIGLFPISMLTSLNTAAAEEDVQSQYTLTFKDDAGEQIDDITGTYSVFVGEDEKIQSKELTITSGKATIDLSSIKEDIENADTAAVTVKIKCEVTDEAGSYKAKGEVVLEKDKTEYDVSLTQYFTITKKVTGSGNVFVVINNEDVVIPEEGLEFAKGTKIIIRATADVKTGERHLLKSFKIGDTNVNIGTPTNSTTYQEITVDKDIEVVAEFARYVNVTFDVPAGGSVTYGEKDIKSDTASTDKSFQVEAGTEIKFTVKPSDNYIIGSVVAGEDNLTAADGKYTVTADSDTDVKVTFTEKGKLSVTSDNGTVNITDKNGDKVEPNSYVSDNIEWTIDVTPQEGYRIASVSAKQGNKEQTYDVKGKEFSFSDTFTSKSSTFEAVTVTVTYQKIFYFDLPDKTDGGKVEVTAKDGELKSYVHNGHTYYDENTQLTLTVTPASNENGTFSHRIKSVTVGDEEKQPKEYFTYTQDVTVSKDTKVSAEFQKIYYFSVSEDNDTNTEVTFKLDGTMTIDDDKHFADAGHTLGITAKSKDTAVYRVKELAVNDTVTAAPAETTEPYETEVTLNEDIVVSASAQEIRRVTVKFDPELGSADLNGKAITNDTELMVDILPDEKQIVTIKAINTAVLEETTVSAEGITAETVKPSDEGTFTLDIADNKYQGKKITIATIFKFKITYEYNSDEGSLYYYGAADDHAEIEVREELTASGSSKYIYILPNEGMAVSKIETDPEISGLSTAAPGEEDTLKGAVRIQIENISKSFKLNITFITLPVADTDKYETDLADADYYDKENDIYYFAHRSFTVKYNDTDGGKIKITDSKGKILSGDSLTFDENTDIASLEVLYKGEDEYAENWHKSADFEKIIRFDNADPSFNAQLSGQKKNDIYSGDVTVTVSGVTDPETSSGIKDITYTVEKDGKQTASGELDVEGGSFVVSADDNNSNDVKVKITVTDNVGNSHTEEYSLSVDVTEPAIKAEYADKSGYSEAGTEYYDKDVTVTVDVTERTPNFEADKVVIKVERLDKEESKDYTGTLEWTHDPTEEPYTDGDTHSTKLTFSEDGHYSLIAEYTDKAGNTAQSKALGFVIDRTAPDAVLSINGNEWSASPDKFGFNNFDHTAEGVIVSLDYSDSLTPIKSVEYYIDDQSKGLIDDGELNEKEFSAYEDELLIEDDSIFAVYVRVTNQLGQVTVFHSGGYIYDKTMPDNIVFTAPQGTVDNLYNGDVNIDVAVSDPGYYSGLKTIVYQVLSNGRVTRSETQRFTEDDTFYTAYDELTEHFERTVTVNSSQNNSNDVKVRVIVTDNANNTFIEDYSLMVDVTAPTLSVTAKTDYQLYEGHKYFDDPTDITITVKEREENFEPDKVKVDIVKELTNSSETEEEYTVIWTANPKNNNTDSDTFTCVIHFNNDAKYSVTVNYTDRAGNAAKSASNTLTVDKTSPTGTVSVNSSKWDELIKNLTFGLYDPAKAQVKATSADVTSPVVKIEYYKTSNKKALSTTTLDKQTFTAFKTFTVNKDEVFTVYIKITDAAGNYTYISTDGYIVDKTPADITLTPAKPNDNGVYKGNVKVDYTVNDRSAYSGIKTVEYKVLNVGSETQSGTLYSFNDPAPQYSLLKNSLSGSITVDSKLNNSSNVTVKLTVTDNAGNKSEKSVKLDIDITAPEIAISYNNNNDHSSGGYFDAARTATVKITERSDHFDASKVKINITAADVKGENVSNAYSVSKWKDSNNSKQPDASTHTATIKFSKDANYTFSISYTDDAGNKNKTPDTGDSVSPYSFTVDTVAPTAEITARSDEGRSVTRNTLVRDLKFGFWSKSGIRITSSSDDVTSPIKSVEYYKVSAKQAEDAARALTSAELNRVTQWAKFRTLDLSDNERSTVYLKVTDMAGNYTYISTDGLIVDQEAPVAETVAPEVTVTPQQPINGLYSSDVTVDISVVDPLVGGAYSGLAEITYSVYDLSQSETVPTQTGTLFEMPYGSPSQGQLTPSWDGKIVVDSELNNSNNVVVEVSATDNAGNSSSRSETLSIDITRPEIDVVYSNNSVQSGHYFSADRTATISIRERNFDPDDVKVTMTTVGGVIPTLSGWSRTAGTGNMDNTVWTATVTFNTDGDYTFGIEYTDEAGNKADAADYNGAAVPEEFTVDKTLPTVNVAYDNNSAANGNYYSDTRTATITVTEHNFNAADVVISVSASDDGNVITAPVISGWTDNGDIHTATINYLADALYTFDVVSITDLAGNMFNNFEQQSFYVDLTAPTLEISGVKDSTAYNSDEIVPIVTYSDTNLNENSVSIEISSVNSGKLELNGEYADIHNGKTFTFANFEDNPEADDIYTLTAKVVDRSGNSTEETVVFSVNRYGSTYQISDEKTQSIITSRYVKEGEDIVISEINADELTEVEITLYKSNSPITLREGEDYEMIVTGGNGEWYNYTYRIFKKNFDDNGEYSIIVHSKDKAGNLSDNDTDTKKTSLNFVVDKTPPVVDVANLEKGVTYAVDSLEVNLTVSDNELALSELTIELDGAEYKKLSAEELTQLLENGGVLTFDISGNKTSAHNVKITCIDLAANPTVVEINDFYVTTDPLLLFYNTKPLFYGSIAGVIVLAGLIVFFIVWKRRKKDKKEA